MEDNDMGKSRCLKRIQMYMQRHITFHIISKGLNFSSITICPPFPFCFHSPIFFSNIAMSLSICSSFFFSRSISLSESLV